MAKRDRTVIKNGKETAAWYAVDTDTLKAEPAKALKAMRDAYAAYTKAREAFEGSLTANAVSFMGGLGDDEQVAWSHRFGTSFAVVPKVKASNKKKVQFA